MGGVGGDPGGCLSKTLFTYTLGPILTIVYLGGIATAIAGGFAQKTVRAPAASAPPPQPQLQVAPTAGPGSVGMVLLGTF
jgi:hypothetical protein